MNTTTTDAIMRAILEEPHDNLHRLAYADLLEEQGQDNHAELIRLQIQMALEQYHHKIHEQDVYSLTTFDDQRMRRASTLISSLNWRWLPSYIWSRANCIWSRGFVSGICLPLQHFMAHAEVMFKKQPITEVYLTDRKPFHEPDDDYSWWDDMDGSYDDEDRSDLPSELFACFGADDWYIAFPLLAEANEALSRACVRYGRRQAGLPELQG